MKILLALGALALSAAHMPAPAHAAEPLSPLVITAPPPGLDPAVLPTTRQSLGAEAIARTISVITPEDTLRYLPNLLVRQRHIGDTQSPVATRTSGVGASARSLIYIDGILISALIGNNNSSASPKWGLVSPGAISTVDVLYGPFSAVYAGNSIGGVIAFTSRMPTGLEGNVQVQGAAQDFRKYADHRTLATGRVAADFGDRRDRLAFRLSYNHLDSAAHPLAYATALTSGAPSATGSPVTGAVPGANRTGQPILLLGSTGIEHQIQDNASGRLTYDLTPTLTAAYAFGLFANADQSTVNSYLRDVSGAPAYAGALNIGGRAYTVAPAAFSSGLYRLDELQLAQGLSVTSHSGGAFDFELTATGFDYLSSRQRAPSGPLPAAFDGGVGSVAVLGGTGWRTLDGKGTWRPGGAHRVSFGLHQDVFTLRNPRYALADWRRSPPGALLASSRGSTQTQAAWLQDVWTPNPQLRATVGARFERWRAYDGANVSAAPVLSVRQPALARDAVSPKAVLAYAPSPGWTLKASVGAAYRFPTVNELYQTVAVGPLLAVPNPDLKPERALSSELSVERVWPRGSLRLSLFDERIADALMSQTANLPAGSSTTGAFVQNIDATHATGVELVADSDDLVAQGVRLSGWITYVDARIDRDAAFPAAVGKALPQLPRWRGAMVATWSPTPRLDVTLAARYSDRAFATLDNSDRNADAYQGFDAYLVVDARLRYRVTPYLTAGVGLENLSNRAYFLFHPFPQRTLIVDLKYSY